MQGYTFGGMKNIRSSTMHSDLTPNQLNANSNNNFSESAFETGREMLTGFEGSQANTANQNLVTLERPKHPKVKNFFDQAYGTNLKKRARERPQSCRSGYSAKSSTISKLRTFKAANPYMHTQSQFFNEQSQAQQKEKKGIQRFNEEISVTSKQVSENRRKRPNSSSRKIIRESYNRGTVDAVKKRLREENKLNKI